jgi:hypothetical protein
MIAEFRHGCHVGCEGWRQPIGVVGVIVPWNFPLEITLNKLGPVLAMGNQRHQAGSGHPMERRGRGPVDRRAHQHSARSGLGPP